MKAVLYEKPYKNPVQQIAYDGFAAIGEREAVSYTHLDVYKRQDEAFSPVRTAAARAAVWDAFLRQDLDLLPATLPDALRASSSALLTDCLLYTSRCV